MNDVAEFTDEWGASVRVERVPVNPYNPEELIEVFINDNAQVCAFVQLNYQQAAALRDALTDLIG